MKDTKSVKVLNRGYSRVAIKGINREYIVEAASGDRPASLLIPFDDVDYINSNTPIFRSGVLTFEDSDKDEVNKMLGNYDIDKTAFTREVIRDIILNPTYEKMERLLAIDSIDTMERFRAELISIKNVGTEGVSGNVERIVNERYKEVNGGLMRTRIALHRDNFSNPVNDELAKKVAELEAKISKMEEPKEAEQPKAPAKTAAKKPAAKTTKPKTTK